MSASGPPLCRICQKEHWMRDPHILPANAPGEVRAKRKMIENNVKTSSAIRTGNPTITMPAPAKRSKQNTRREGRDVLKGAKPTSTASTERPNPSATPGKPAGKKGRNAAKPSPGKRKPRTKIIATYTPPTTAKKKGKKK